MDPSQVGEEGWDRLSGDPFLVSVTRASVPGAMPGIANDLVAKRTPFLSSDLFYF